MDRILNPNCSLALFDFSSKDANPLNDWIAALRSQ